MWQQKEEIKNINDENTKASFELIWLLVNESCVLVYDSQRPCGNSCLFRCYMGPGIFVRGQVCTAELLPDKRKKNSLLQVKLTGVVSSLLPGF